MTEVKPLSPTDYPAFAWIAQRTYPVIGLHTAADRETFVAERLTATQNETDARFFGAYRDGVLRGGMRLIDYTMNVFGAQLTCGGVGFVAVDTDAKRQGVASALIRGYLRYYREHGAALAALYPFRPDFYKKMGFGFGTKLHTYRLPPAQLPDSPLRTRCRTLMPDDAEALAACYARAQAHTHGLFAKRAAEAAQILKTPENRIVGYLDETDTLRGYFIYQIRPGPSAVQYDAEIRECISETPAAFAGLLGWLNSQSDQLQRLIIHTQDPHFHYLAADPRDGSGTVGPHAFHQSHTSGVGIMYRIIDLPRLFAQLAQHRFGGQTITLAIELADSFLPEHAATTTVRFDHGAPTVVTNVTPDATLRIAVGELSALLLGCVPLTALLNFGLATLDAPDAAATVAKLFAVDTPPVCVTRF